MHTHRIQIFDAADNHNVVCQIPHDLELKFLPTEKRLLNQNLRHRAGLKAAFANRRVFLWVVGDAATTAPKSEGWSNDPWITADCCANSIRFLEA